MRNKNNFLGKIIVTFAIILVILIVISLRNINRDRPLEMIYISKSVDQNNEFWMALTSGAKMASKEYNVNLTVVAPSDEANYKEQNELISEAIKKKPDAILLSPSSYTETKDMAEKIKENGIKLILIDCTIDSDLADSIVSTGNYDAGEKMGIYMKNLINKETKIAIVSHVKESSTAIDRENGLRDTLGDDEDKIVDVVFCESKYDKAYNLTKQLIEEHPDINIIAALNEYSSIGAAKAIKELGLSKQIVIIGFDNSIEEVKLLEEGVINAIVIQKPFNMGYFGIEQAVNIVKGQNYIKYLDCGSELIIKEDMYTEENQKMLFPFLGRQFREVSE